MPENITTVLNLPDADLGKAMLGNSIFVVDPDEQTLESRVPIGIDFSTGV